MSNAHVCIHITLNYKYLCLYCVTSLKKNYTLDTISVSILYDPPPPTVVGWYPWKLTVQGRVSNCALGQLRAPTVAAFSPWAIPCRTRLCCSIASSSRDQWLYLFHERGSACARNQERVKTEHDEDVRPGPVGRAARAPPSASDFGGAIHSMCTYGMYRTNSS
jgi:hypothetical protein